MYIIRDRATDLFSKGKVFYHYGNSRLNIPARYNVQWTEQSYRAKLWSTEALVKKHLLLAARKNIDYSSWEVIKLLPADPVAAVDCFDDRMLIALIKKPTV